MADNRNKLFDRRTMDRYIEKGLLKEANVKEYFKSLPDDAANAQWVQMDLHDAELTGEDDVNADLGAEGDESDADSEGA